MIYNASEGDAKVKHIGQTLLSQSFRYTIIIVYYATQAAHRYTHKTLKQ